MTFKQIITGLLLIAILASCSPTPTSSSTATPIVTIPPGVTPTDTSEPTFTPSPTPTPEVRLASADQAFFDGDYDRAYNEYLGALNSSADPAQQAAALWGLGRDYYALKNYVNALAYFNQLDSQFPASPDANRAYFMLGEIYMQLGRYSEAAQAYTTYLALLPRVIDAYAQERRGDAYIAAGSFSDGISAYQAALAAEHITDDTGVRIKIANAYVSMGDTTTGLQMFDTIATATSNDYVKAQMDLLSGQVYLSLGQVDQAYQRFLHAVNNYPLAYDSYSALVALVNAGVTVDEMNRGLVDYFAGQYGYALDAFQRFIDSNPQNDGNAVYYKALTYYHLGQYAEAETTWISFIHDYPNNPHWADAWNGNASLPGLSYTQWYWLDKLSTAEETLLEFIQRSPNNPSAPDFLMDVARLQERDGQLKKAAQTWEKVASSYPGSILVPQALFWAGIAYYRLADYKTALVTFQRDSILSTLAEDKARATFWTGKAQQAMGDNSSATNTWQLTASFDPTDYYSLRAQDLLFNRQPFTSSTNNNLILDLAKERKDADAWLRVTFNLPTDTALSTAGALLTDARLIRGTELWKLGQTANARAEFDALQTSVEQNAANSYRLANYLLDIGLYYPAIVSMRQVLTLAGMTTQAQTLAAPAYFNHVRYGLYYKELILPAAQQAGFDPLFIYAVIRQESLFDKSAGSPYANGLMQITPGTGKLIAENLGWPPNYTADDLLRPLISIGLGTSYLMTQRNRWNGDLFSVLAAYNAGPEATPIWRDLSGPDSDLFVEVIRYDETRTYIRSIYEIYSMYRTLYGSTP
jgi:soluble lytic murein transglycosylase